MAFGKKKKDEEAPDGAASEAPPEPAPEPASDEEVSGSVLANEAPVEDATAITAGPVAEEPPAASADPLGGDLLNMFQTTQIETEDVTVLLDLAGDVELDDLLEDLRTVAAALGIKLCDEELAAA